MGNDVPSAQPLTDEDVRKVARLARLELTDDEIDDARRRLTAVLGYVERLQQLDLDDVRPMAHAHESVNRLRADEPAKPVPTEEFERIAPAWEDGFVRVPRVLGDGGSA